MLEFTSENVNLLNVRGQHLAATIYRPQKPTGRGVLFIHGWVSSRKSPAEYAANLAAKGYICLVFDLSGMGESEGDLGTLTRKDFLNDSLAAYDYLQAIPGVHSISVVGTSFGSYLACLLAGKREVRDMVLRVPADFTDEGFDSQPQILLSDRYDKEGLGMGKLSVRTSYAIEALKKFKGKVLIVQSEKDTIVGPDMVKRFADAVPGNNLTHIVMQGAPHTLSRSAQYRKEFAGILDDWFMIAD